ncbi:MAG: right-handed parallel beta-helix repeat-containing protein [Candidatus Latescibacterota bacterium]
MIAHIRAVDSVRRIVAIGNVRDDPPPGPHWTSTPPGTSEQDLFRQTFFRPATEPGPANVLMHEDYRLWDSDNTEQEVQQAFDDMMVGWDRAGDMVATALLENRRAEWHFIANVRNQYDTPGQPPHYRDPTLEELRAQVNLALSRGAKGTTYFLYTSSVGYVSGYQYEGLVNTSTPRGHILPQWYTVQQVNNGLRPLGDAVYPLTWVDGFAGSAIPGNSFVKSTTGSYVEFGTFYDSQDSDRDYVLVVNRQNLTVPSAYQTVNVTLDADDLRCSSHGQGVYLLTDVLSGAAQGRSTDVDGRFVLRCPNMPPGSAQLLRIERSDTWSGQVTLAGDVRVPAGMTLNIDPGTDIRVLTGDDQPDPNGTYPDRTELIVQGALLVDGNMEEGPVTFCSADNPTLNTAWGGLRTDSGAQATFHWVRIENATRGIHLNGTPALLDWGGTDHLAGTRMDLCNLGVYATGVQNRVIENIDISGSVTGVRLYGCSQTTVRRVRVVGNSGNGVEVEQGSGNQVQNTTLIGDGQTYMQRGIYLSNTAGPTTLENNIITKVYYGIEAFNSSGITTRNNGVWQCSSSFFGLTPSGTTYYVPPRLVADGSDQLASDSPLVNAAWQGAGKLAAVRQTNPLDIGRYGGTSADHVTALASTFYSTDFGTEEEFTELAGSWN